MLPLLGFINIPTIDTLITSTSEGAVPGMTGAATTMFNNLADIALVIAGLIIGVLLVRLFIIKGLLKGVKRLTGGR